jgi:UDP-N-acetylmuramate--alanine ligase
MYNPRLHFHFIGIGGSGMSGLAEILLTSGFQVSGSDLKASDVSRRLEKLGAKVNFGHAATNLPASASLVVYSSAIVSSNPEIREAKRRKIPVVRRAEVLAELMRLKYGVGVAGSHGKTTTTSMCGVILDAAHLDPTVVIGGQVKSLGTGGRLGKGDYLVAETDESDRSFLLLKPTVAIVTNIDDEHLNAYRSRRDLEESFNRFVQSVPFYGVAILCIDDPVVRQIAADVKRRVVTYGFSPDADLQAVSIEATPSGMHFDVVRKGESLGRFTLPMWGRHLVQNCLAAIGVGLEFGVDVTVIRSALASFGGVKRRLEVIGEESGVTVMSDYGHHPTEIRATLRAIRECRGEAQGAVYTLFQPHRYSRTQQSWNEFLQVFGDTDHLVLTDIYAASEKPLTGITGEAFFRAVVHPSKEYVASLEDAVGAIVPRLRAGDLVLCLGAGSVGAMPEKFLAAINAAPLPTATVDEAVALVAGMGL